MAAKTPSKPSAKVQGTMKTPAGAAKPDAKPMAKSTTPKKSGKK